MTTTKTPHNSSSHKLLLWLIALVSLAMIAVAGVAMVTTAQAGAWLTFAFNGTVIVAGALGVIQGLGKFREGPALTAVCIAGTFFTAGFLGYYGAGGNIAFRTLLGGDLGAFNAGKLPTWVLLAELVAAGVVGATAGLLALARSPGESWKQLVLGILLFTPVLLIVGSAYKLGLASRIASMNMIIATIIAVTLFAVLIGLLSASVNAFIKAFAAGLPDLDAPPATAGTQKTAAGSPKTSS